MNAGEKMNQAKEVFGYIQQGAEVRATTCLQISGETRAGPCSSSAACTAYCVGGEILAVRIVAILLVLSLTPVTFYQPFGAYGRLLGPYGMVATTTLLCSQW